MKSAEIKKEEIEVLDWLDEYEAWNLADEAFKDLNDYDKKAKFYFYFDIKTRQWKFKKCRKNSTEQIEKSISGEHVLKECYEYEHNPEGKILAPEDKEIIVNHIIEGTKNYVKRYFG